MSLLICLRDIQKYYNQNVHALRGIDLIIDGPQTVAITGRSGSGKSTLLYILGCLEIPSQGSYRFAGMETAFLSDRTLSRIRSEQIGFVFQSYNLISYLTVAQNVEIPLRYRKLHGKEIELQVQQVLKQVNMEHRAHHRPSELSGGEAQRVAIARALVINPSLILADEPTGSLDSITSEQILGLFWKLKEQGVIVVMATHDKSIAMQADRHLNMCDGVLRE